MKKHFLLVVLAALTAVVGCKKDKEDTNNPSNPPAGKLLKRLIETEDGVTTTYTLAYDGNKRVTAIKSSDNTEQTTFTYDAKGNITKIENKEDDTKNIFEFTYNNDVPVSGVFKSYEMTGGQQGELQTEYTLNYTVANGLVTKIALLMQDDEGGDLELTYLLTYTNGNLTKIETEGMNAYTTTFTYGNKKPVFPAAFKYILDPGGFSVQFFAKNEILSIAYDFPDTELDNTITTQYTYDANGYVLTSNDGTTQIKYEYE